VPAWTFSLPASSTIASVSGGFFYLAPGTPDESTEMVLRSELREIKAFRLADGLLAGSWPTGAADPEWEVFVLADTVGLLQVLRNRPSDIGSPFLPDRIEVYDSQGGLLWSKESLFLSAVTPDVLVAYAPWPSADGRWLMADG